MKRHRVDVKAAKYKTGRLVSMPWKKPNAPGREVGHADR
jgi:hypothetical protein